MIDLHANEKHENQTGDDYTIKQSNHNSIYPEKIEPDVSLPNIDDVRKRWADEMPITIALDRTGYAESGGAYYPIQGGNGPHSANADTTRTPLYMTDDDCIYAKTVDRTDPLADGYRHDSFSVCRLRPDDPDVSWSDVYSHVLSQLGDEESADETVSQQSRDISVCEDLRDRMSEKLAEAGVEGITPEIDAIYRSITGSFWSGANQKLHVLTDRGTINRYTGAQAVGALARRYGSLVDYSVIAQAVADKEAAKGAEKIPGEILMSYIQDKNQADLTEWRVDMFGGADDIQMVDNRARISLEHRPFPVTHKADERVIEDYKEHFPRLDEFLDFVVDSRFASDRKQSYLWIQADSDWGKSFLLSTLGSCVVTTSATEVEAMLSGSPVGRQPEDFTQCLVLAIDEFKSVKSEIKQLQSYLPLSPKNQMTTSVPIYAKLFLSAEGVDSLANSETGVEDQFANRMSVFQESGNLTDRDLFHEVGKKRYFDAVRAYVADYLNRGIAAKQADGVDKAAHDSDAALFKFHRKYGLEQYYTRLSDELENIADDILGWINEKRKDEAYGIDIIEDDGDQYLKCVGKVISEYLNAKYDRAQLGTLGRKKSDLTKLISKDGEGNRTWQINGSIMKAVKLKDSKRKTKLKKAKHLNRIK